MGTSSRGGGGCLKCVGGILDGMGAIFLAAPQRCNAYVLILVLVQDSGNPERSGKMHVLVKVLRHWHQQGHK